VVLKMPSTDKKAHVSRNPLLAKGVERHSRSVSYHRKGKWAVKNKSAVVKKTVETPKVTKTLKNGQTRTIVKKTARSYPADDVKRPVASRKAASRPARLRSSLTPGTVVILLAGRFRGKRAVFLKQLDSGLLLVTGPYKINGIPLRRVNQAYVVATSTKVDLSALKLDAKFNDSYFKKPVAEKKAKTEGEFFAEEKKKAIEQSRVTDQKSFDGAILAAVKKVPQLEEYLGARFTLKRGEFPHDIQF